MSKYLLKSTLLFYILALAIDAHSQKNDPLIITIDLTQKAQLIDNIGASGCWFSEGIGKYCPQQKKERIAELLFSKKLDANGNPMGIGLSAWRFNIGGGTAEQGDSSGIKDFRKRVECFLSPDGTYNWNKQEGYQWFLKKAKSYGVEKLIAFSNTPPVQFTQNGLGYKTVKDYKANLKPGKYLDYTAFLTTVLKHFDREGLHFEYVSPVNEPQWDWSKKYMEADQEGSPWANDDISYAAKLLDSLLTLQKLSTKILLPEAGLLTSLYEGSGQAPSQVQNFYNAISRNYIGKLKHLPAVVAGHSYFTDAPDSNLINVRKQLADTARKYGVDFWQSEYCMLADGFREGTGAKRTAMDCALFLAKVIHTDLTVGNAAAWQFWNSLEPGIADTDTRYYLIALKPNEKHTDGAFTATKNLWALGHYSLFVRPGMQRINIKRSDKLSDIQQAQQVMVSAFANKEGSITIVAINYTQQPQALKLNLANADKHTTFKSYTTTAVDGENMKASAAKKVSENAMLPARSITTIVIK